MKQKSKKIIITLGIIIGSIFLIAGVFFGAYEYVINQAFNSYTKSINNCTQDINKVNESTGVLIKGETIDIEKTKNSLEDKINKLLTIKEAVDASNPSEKYRISRDNLSAGLNSNIYIYRQISQIIGNPQAKDSEKALEDLSKYKSECIKYYSLINIKNIKISLPSNFLTFIDNTSYYLSETIKLKKGQEISQGQNTDFLSNLDEIISKLLPIKIDFTPYAISGRSGSFDEALSNVDNNMIILNDIKDQFDKLIVPANKISIYRALSDTINSEESYIQGFRYALDIERRQAISTPLKPDEITQLYSDANTCFKNLNDNYDTFFKLYTDFKNNPDK